MAISQEKFSDQVDRILIEGCENADEAACAEPSHSRNEFAKLSAQAKCAMTFIKQWAADAKLPVAVSDIETILTLQFARSAPAGDHVHERILQGLTAIGSKAIDDPKKIQTERDSLRRINDVLTSDHRATINGAIQSVRDVTIVLGVDPDEHSVQTAVFLLAKLIDPELGE